MGRKQGKGDLSFPMQQVSEDNVSKYLSSHNLASATIECLQNFEQQCRVPSDPNEILL